MDLPGVFFRRAKSVMARSGMTSRSVVNNALDQALDENQAKDDW